MKKTAIVSLLLLFIGSLGSTSWRNCPGPGMGENSFIINGEGFQNKKITIAITASEFEHNYYAKGSFNYFEEYKNMTVRISGSNTYSKINCITGIHMDFHEFVNPGIYKIDSAVSVSIFFKQDNSSLSYSNYYMFDSNGEINIKKYDPVGGLIEGTFDGTFVKMNYNVVTNRFEETDKEVIITNGKFSVVRQPDFHWDAPISNVLAPGTEGRSKKKK